MKALLAAGLAAMLLGVLVGCMPVQPPELSQASTGAPATLPASAPVTATAVATATVGPAVTVAVTPTETLTPTAVPTSAPTNTPVETPTTAPTPTLPPTDTPLPPTPTAAPTSTEGPPPTATPLPATVFVRNDRSYREGNSFVVVGEVVNGSPSEVYNVKVIATFYDAASKLVGAQESVAFLPQTVSTQANPFKVQLPNAPGTIATYELTLTWDDLTIATYDRVTITREEVRQENGLTLSGDLRNDHRRDIRNIVVVATFYDEQGLVLAVIPGNVGLNTLAPGGVTTFTIRSPEPLAYSSYLVQTVGLLLP